MHLTSSEGSVAAATAYDWVLLAFKKQYSGSWVTREDCVQNLGEETKNYSVLLFCPVFYRAADGAAFPCDVGDIQPRCAEYILQKVILYSVARLAFPGFTGQISRFFFPWSESTATFSVTNLGTLPCKWAVTFYQLFLQLSVFVLYGIS